MTENRRVSQQSILYRKSLCGFGPGWSFIGELLIWRAVLCPWCRGPHCCLTVHRHSQFRIGSEHHVTIFSKIINREIDVRIVYEDDLCLAFHDVSPQAPVHVLLIPKKNVESLDELQECDTSLAGHLLLQVPQIATELGLNDGYRTIINTGRQGGQTVFHLHIHILGGRNLTWPPG